MPIEKERWVSVSEIAEHLGVCKDTIYTWLAEKQMPAHKVGRLWKFKIAQVDKWIENGGANRGLTKNQVKTQ
ncbi:MAG: helix-turn-helix domain-containing protein [Victivallaceae bacterium]|nr:helix-turn-helix domain-containing protein [Victivallaceae bacterium]